MSKELPNQQPDEPTNGELIENLRRKIESGKMKIPAMKGKNWELAWIEQGIIESVPLLDPYKKKLIFREIFGLMGETLEVQQLHQLMFKQESDTQTIMNRVDEVKRELKSEITDFKRENKNAHRILQAAVTAIAIGAGSVFANESGIGQAVIEFILALLGIG